MIIGFKTVKEIRDMQGIIDDYDRTIDEIILCLSKPGNVTLIHNADHRVRFIHKEIRSLQEKCNTKITV
jgi:hypothetical protein